MARTKKNVGPAKTQDMSQKKTRLPLIYWCKANIEVIVMWMDQRDKKGIAVNYKAWTTRNHTDVAAGMLIETRLEGKNRVTKKKAADKLEDMIKSYKDMKETADQTG